MAGEVMSLTLIGKILEFLVELGKRTSWCEIKLQSLIDDIANVAPEFIRFLQNGGRMVITSNERWRKLSDTAIEVNLDAPVTSYLDDALPECRPPAKRGWVKVERVGETIVVDGRKVILHLKPTQSRGVIKDNNRCKPLQENILDPRVLDALVEFKNGHLIPVSWKQDSQGRTLYLHVSGVGFRVHDGSVYVRSLCWRSGQWRRYILWLGNVWAVQRPALRLAS